MHTCCSLVGLIHCLSVLVIVNITLFKAFGFSNLPPRFISLPFFKSIVQETRKQRHTLENISKPQLFFQASVMDECALSLQSFALEICQLSHHGITETL